MSDADYVTPEEFANVTGLSLVTVYRRLRAGQLPADQSGGHRTAWRIDLVAFRARVTAGSSRPTKVAAAIPPSGGSIKRGTAPTSAATSTSPSSPALNGPLPRWTTRIPK